MPSGDCGEQRCLPEGFAPAKQSQPAFGEATVIPYCAVEVVAVMGALRRAIRQSAQAWKRARRACDVPRPRSPRDEQRPQSCLQCHRDLCPLG